MSEDLILSALARLESGQTAMHAEFTAFGVEFNSFRAAVTAELTALRADVTRLEAGYAAMREELTTLRVELMARMDRLQNTLSAVRDDVVVNMGASDAAQRVNENTREDLRSPREQVSVMWRQLKAVEARVREISDGP